MDRIYEALIREHLLDNRQMVFLSGPRQVGKTTSARTAAGEHTYYNWDEQSDRRRIVQGVDALREDLQLDVVREKPTHIVFDEVHKYGRWKSFLKGLYDRYADQTRMVVTGSARLGFFSRGGDSLMGRYFPYRMHPLSLAELQRQELHENTILLPRRPPEDALPHLLEFGGFPEPFLRASARFYNRWRKVRTELLFREDLRDLTRIQEVGQVEVLAEVLSQSAGQQINYSTLAGTVNVSVDTIRRWMAALEALFYSFSLRPWSRSVPKSLRKQPKVYLWDWSLLEDRGARRENLVACHLLKAVHWWTDIGLGTFALHYLRDKAKREVDFLVTRDGAPWFMVEVKSSDRQLSPALVHFAGELKVQHALQLVFDLDYVERDCFSIDRPVVVPATTLLSQLV